MKINANEIKNGMLIEYKNDLRTNKRAGDFEGVALVRRSVCIRFPGAPSIGLVSAQFCHISLWFRRPCRMAKDKNQ